MAKANMTAERVADLVNAASEAAQAASAIDDAIGKMKVDDLPDAERQARSLVAAARDLSQTALALFNCHAMQQQQKEVDEIRAKA